MSCTCQTGDVYHGADPLFFSLFCAAAVTGVVDEKVLMQSYWVIKLGLLTNVKKKQTKKKGRKKQGLLQCYCVEHIYECVRNKKETENNADDDVLLRSC